MTFIGSEKDISKNFIKDNFNEIYFGTDIQPPNAVSLLLRPLDKDRKPIKDINLACSDDKVWLENCIINRSDTANLFVEIVDDTVTNFYKTQERMIPYNQSPYLILFDKSNLKTYKVIEDLTGTKVFELEYSKDFGYSFRYLIAPGSTLIDRIKRV